MFSCLVSLIGGLGNEQSLTIFYRWEINTYIHTYILKKESKTSFCRQGRLNNYKSLNLFSTYTISVDTLLGTVNVSHLHS